MTVNVALLHDVPQTLSSPSPADLVEVRGEVYMSRADLRALNIARAARGLPAFANCRNAAAGTLRKPLSAAVATGSPATDAGDNSLGEATRVLRFFAYHLAVLSAPPDASGTPATAPLPTGQWSTLTLLSRLGFQTPPHACLVPSGDADAAADLLTRLQDRLSLLQAQRDALDFDVDGCV